METTINQRIKLLLERSDLSIRKFSLKIGTSEANLRKLIYTEASPTHATLDRLCEACPDVNPIWLYKGEGDMIVSPKTVEEKVLMKELETEVQKLKEDNDFLRRLLETIVPKKAEPEKISAKLKGHRNYHEITKKAYKSDLEVTYSVAHFAQTAESGVNTGVI